ncbi:serine/threonine-protein kinase pim-1 isoform X2 [Larimichthys crocea]|uniref:serine/threonine-protein kinase pim-1 isoform X2 n=1 Tax=Larimichthys crocea TaxID=215358 RepID=UPI000F5DFD97|nr:serine/threonine-protein kinase pim-1 isoform X2 [Larimichthys crocea]
MPRESEGSSMDDQTRRGKRKASPAPKKAKRKRTRVSKSPPRNTPEKNVNRRVKRKVREDGEESPKTKKRAFDIIHLTQDDDEMASSSADTGRDSSRPFKEVSERKRRRKASNDGGKPKRKRSVDIVETTQDVTINACRDKFEDKYVQQNQLGEGGCGSVFAGYRKADNLPVAIKHVPNEKVFCKHVDNNGKKISVEVATMLKLAEGTTGVGTSASVALLDWYDLDKELILVMERPVPAVDLLKYIQGKGGSIDENEAKIIMKQLVDAAKELKDKCIFHRDIKVENILIETGSGTPRLRLIDFGLSCFVKEKSRYHIFYGTPDHIPPEWFRRNTYHAGPTTVWQVGVVLYESVHGETRFATKSFTRNKQKISNELSKKCQDFLKGCLAKVPEDRPTLEQLQLHPWFR